MLKPALAILDYSQRCLLSSLAKNLKNHDHVGVDPIDNPPTLVVILYSQFVTARSPILAGGRECGSDSCSPRCNRLRKTPTNSSAFSQTNSKSEPWLAALETLRLVADYSVPQSHKRIDINDIGVHVFPFGFRIQQSVKFRRRNIFVLVNLTSVEDHFHNATLSIIADRAEHSRLYRR
jgi:hypothetical protein